MSLIFLFLFSFAKSRTPFDAPDFQINLDEPPELRWKLVFESKKQELHTLVTYIDTFVNFFQKKYFSDLVLASNAFPADTIKEMQSLADFLNTDISTIIIGNLGNELTSRCTSILARNSKGEVILSRNMDFGYTHLLKNLTINAHFYRSGELLYHSITSAGFFGVSTAMKPDSFAISINQRNMHDSYVLWELIGLMKESKLVGMSVRYAMENFYSFEEAADYFIGAPLIIGQYIAICGKGDGVVITRDRKYVSDYKALDEENWFVVQTNYDHWLPQPKNDDRYTEVVKKVQDIGQQGISEDVLKGLLQRAPTLMHTTVFSAVANPSSGYWKGFGWS